MASKSLKDKSKVCESCDKKFGWNKRLVDHLDKVTECKEFYISKEITLPVTKSKGPTSKDISEEILNISENEELEEQDKVSVLKIYEEFNETEQKTETNMEATTIDKPKRKNYDIDIKIAVIQRIEAEGVDNMETIALDMRLKLKLLKSWWENKDKLMKIKSLQDKKAQLARSKVGELVEMEDTVSDVETTLEERSAPVGEVKSVEKKKRSKRVCGKCSGCMTEDCGLCKHCLDKPKFGGKNTIKQRCLKKVCFNLQVEKKVTEEKKEKVKRRNSRVLSTSSDIIPGNTEVVNQSLADSPMDSTEAIDIPEKVASDDLDELRNALGSIGADYSRSWTQEYDQFPVLSSNHPSIAEPTAVVTIERIEKKKKKKIEASTVSVLPELISALQGSPAPAENTKPPKDVEDRMKKVESNKESPRFGTVTISRAQVEYLRTFSTKIVKKEMSQADAARVTGLSLEIVSSWVASLEDILGANKEAMEKAEKYDKLLAQYKQMIRQSTAELKIHKDFLLDIDRKSSGDLSTL